MKRDELKCYLDDVQLMDESQLKDYEWNYSKFKFKYYRLLRRSSNNVYKVNYSDLLGWVHELSNDFFDKFPSIGYVVVTGPVDQDHFEWFIKKLRLCYCLSLTNTSLDEAFMHNLSSILQCQLTNLTINETSASLRTDFNFILHFERLYLFATNQQFDGVFDLAAKAFENQSFCQLTFKDGREHVQISRNHSSRGFYNLKAFKLTKILAREQTYCKRKVKWAKLIELWKRRKERKLKKRKKPGASDEATGERKRLRAES